MTKCDTCVYYVEVESSWVCGANLDNEGEIVEGICKDYEPNALTKAMTRFVERIEYHYEASGSAEEATDFKECFGGILPKELLQRIEKILE